MTKISDFTSLTGAGVDQANDVIPIIDDTETGTARNKKITVAELMTLAVTSDEIIDDRVSNLLVAGINITLTYNDGANTLTIDAASTSGDITDFNEAVDDRVGALIDAGTGINVVYDDVAGTLTITATGAGAGGAITTSGFEMATARILGRTTASTGAIEEITVGSGLSLSGGSLAASGLASTSQTAEQISGFIASPSDKSYTLAVKMAHAGTITETTTISASGTCTATFKINSTALGGTANSVSSAEESQAHASNNAFSAGDDIVLTVSSNSSCADMSFTIKYTRTLA